MGHRQVGRQVGRQVKKSQKTRDVINGRSSQRQHPCCVLQQVPLMMLNWERFLVILTYLPNLSYSITSDFGDLGPPTYKQVHKQSLMDVLCYSWLVLCFMQNLNIYIYSAWSSLHFQNAQVYLNHKTMHCALKCLNFLGQSDLFYQQHCFVNQVNLSVLKAMNGLHLEKILKFDIRPYSAFNFGGRNRKPKAENFHFWPKVSASGIPLLTYMVFSNHTFQDKR